MKRYIILVIAALAAFGQSVQCSEVADVRQMWQWNFPRDLYEVIEDLEKEIGRLTILDAPYSDIITLQKAAEALEADAYESKLDILRALDTGSAVFPIAEPEVKNLKVGVGVFALSSVGITVGFALFYCGLKIAYDAYYGKECTSKETTIAGNLGLAAVGAAMVCLAAPMVYEGLIV